MVYSERQDTPPTVITGAAEGRSAEASRRQRNYLIMMAIRVLCFVGLLWAPGNTKWVLLAGAVVLPYIAVLVVNQTDQRSKAPGQLPGVEERRPEPSERLAVSATPEVIEGEVVSDPRGVLESAAVREDAGTPQRGTTPRGTEPHPGRAGR